MLQIRLNKGGSSSADGGGGGTPSGAGPVPAKSASVTAETVTVACPDHLVIADLPVAKSLGTLPPPTASVAFKPVGRRSRRHLGERVHFCVCCDFPVAIYGRLMPCEHAFCLTCARSDSSCYICDERIQKIQTIKMMEGIFICGAPHCLRSFLKSSDFETHVHEAHGDLVMSKMEREGAHDVDNVNITRPSSADSLAKQSAQPESSTARAPSRPGFSPSSNSQFLDRDDRARRNQSREQTPMRPPLQSMPLPFHGQQQPPFAESQPGNNISPQVWFQQSQSFENQNGPSYRRDSDQSLPEKHAGLPQESSFPDYPPPFPLHLPNFSLPMIINQGLNLPPFNYSPFRTDGSQQYFVAPFEIPRPEMAPEGGREQVSSLGYPPSMAGVAAFPDSFSSQWNNNAGVKMQFEQMSVAMGDHANPEVYMNPPDGHGRAAVVLTPQSMQPHMPISLPPPPPLPAQGYGWKNDK